MTVLKTRAETKSDEEYGETLSKDHDENDNGDKQS